MTDGGDGVTKANAAVQRGVLSLAQGEERPGNWGAAQGKASQTIRRVPDTQEIIWA